MTGDELDEAAQTAAEHVAAAAADPSAGPRARARPSRDAALSPDAEAGHCANCGTTLQGPVCHNCGQLADEFHRPVRGLLTEIVEGLFSLDGRVARTLPNLLLRPGRITREFLKGRRARFMPPFRLYIIASLIFFLLVPVATNTFQTSDPEIVRDAFENGANFDQRLEGAVSQGELSPEEAEEIRASLAQLGIDEVFRELQDAASDPGPQADEEAGDGQAPAPSEPGEGRSEDPPDAAAGADASPETGSGEPVFQLGLERGDGEERTFDIGGDRSETAAQSIRRFFTPEDFGEPAPEDAWPYAVRSYLADRFGRVAEDPGAWLEEAAEWIPRIMFAMVPVYALLLSLTYAWRRGFFLYDHLIVSVHFHAALFLAMTVFYLAAYVLPGGLMVLAFILYSNLYLYKLHRVVYERSRITSLLRTLALDFVYAVILMFALMSALLLGALAV